ncbi:COMM domain-containing protein 5 [Bradysia coprophila]|uniref:COMM domain-containing protein 5 n=1 Tax=Bradysia coprophila TaxID=38358 RepID=UPI00187DC162|nr:COMM domain-containing protein 5 [Bradysia coprophila]
MSTNFKYNLNKSLKKYVKYIPQLSKPVLRVLIQVSVHYIESRNCPSEVLDIALNKLSHTGCEIPENFYELFSACIQIMQLFLRTPKGSVKNEELRENLRDLRFSEECIDDICKVLHNHRDSLTQNYCEVKSLRTPPKRINWCINLSLIESGITRIAQPSIVLHLQMRNGEYRTFEVPMVMFHKLRYSVACLLKEFQALESRQIMKK